MIKKKKIIIAITKANWGGAQKYVYDLATNLPNDLFEVKVITGRGGELTEQLQKSNIQTLEINNLKRDIGFKNDSLSAIAFLKLLKKERPDILHLNSSKIGLLGVIIGRVLGIPRLIFTAHGWAFNENRGWYQKIILKFLQRLTVSLSHHTIAVSEQTKKQIGQSNWYSHKITIIKNGVAEIDFLSKDQAREIISKKLKKDIADNYIIGCIAELHKNKGLRYLIEACALLKKDGQKNIVTVIIGEGEERGQLVKQISESKLNEDLFLTGKIPYASRLLKAFDIFVLPSITEALPYVLLEAGQAGLPIISTSVGGIAEIIDDAENGLIIRSENPKDLYGAIKYLKDNSDKSLILSQKIKEKISQEFKIKDMVEKTIAMYK